MQRTPWAVPVVEEAKMEVAEDTEDTEDAKQEVVAVTLLLLGLS